MGILKGASGMLKVRLISADTAVALNEISTVIQVSRVRHIDGLTVDFWIKRTDMHLLNNIVQRRGDRLEILSHQGIYWKLKRLIKRPVLAAGIVLLLFLTAFLPTRVLFIRVEGNDSVPTRMILEAASECGIDFGSSTRMIRSEKVKNSLLQRIPQLQWAGINTDGCVAVISVREKTAIENSEFKYPISSMVALRDGYITELTVRSGSSVCRVGQSVKKGQVLISAYTDCGIYLRASKAEGEVFATTQHEFSTLMPTQLSDKTLGEDRYQNFAIIIGKKQINFTKGSGISSPECDRIKTINYLTLPGGFTLPIAFVTETVTCFNVTDAMRSEQHSRAFLQSYSQQYMKNSMISGKIESCQEHFTQSDGVFVMTGRYQCNEMIAISRTEEILQNNEQNSGTVH